MTEIDKFVRELAVRKYAFSTIETYRKQAEFIIANFGIKPDIEQVKEYLLTLESQSHHKQVVATIRHYFKFVHGVELSLDDLPYPRKETKLPVILSEEEMKRLIDVPKNIKHQLIIYILYGCGLRVGELLSLKICDIDRGQMCLHIKGAKGNKDRTVGISEKLLSFIEKYYHYNRPKEYLFNGQFCLRYTASSINQFLRRYAKQARINKRVHCHLLRTCYAVHSLDKNIDMGLLQRSMGHGNIKVTHHYTRMSSAHLKHCLV